MNVLKRSVLGGLAVLGACVVGMPSGAVAAEPWWHVSTLSAPASVNTSESQVVLDIANLGDAATQGSLTENVSEALAGESKHFVTVTDTLPAGVLPVGVRAEGGGQSMGIEEERHIEEALSSAGRPSLCSINGQTVRCEYATPVRPYEHIIVAVTVKVAEGSGSGMSVVSVSGGGAPAIVSRHQLALEGSPAYGVQNYELTAEEEGGLPTTQAGSHPYQLTTTLILKTRTTLVKDYYFHDIRPEVSPIAMTKDLRFNLPQGMVGNPTRLPKCSVYEFSRIVTDRGTCPDNTVVGVAAPIVANPSKAPFVPYAFSTPIFNLEPSMGEPARFGFQTPFGPVILDTSVRTGGDYGVVVTVPNITQGAAFIGNVVTLWGVPGDPRHDDVRGVSCLSEAKAWGETPRGAEPSCPIGEKPQPFVIMPSACEGPLRTTVEPDSWQEPGRFLQPFPYTSEDPSGQPYGLDGCNRLNFEPSISVAPDGQEGASPTGLTVGVHVPQEASLNPSGLAESSVLDTRVTLPAGVSINPGGADGLQACGLAEVGLESASEQVCPEASKIGTVEIHTPLLPNPLVGAAYLAQQNANPFGSLVAMYLVVKDPVSGVIVKLAGKVQPDPVTGQLVSTFDDTPELPFEDLKLHFFGGSRAPLGTPALCGSYTTTASIVPWSGNAPVDSSSEFSITSGPNNTPCSDPLPFAPELTTGSLNIQAGAFTPFSMTMSRQDGNQNLDAIQLKMPSGLLGEISKVKLCREADADAGSCGAESLIGETTVSVGLGGNPYAVKGGRVYITGPYEGAPYGLSIVNPAKAGPFDLGQVVVRARIDVDPVTAAITITSDASGPYRIPQIIDGIPLEIKHVNVTITRPEFTFNPTDCEPQQIGGSLTSSEGAMSVLHVPFQVTNCATLKFKPVFRVSTNGKTSRSNGASLHVKLTYPKAPFGSQANIGYVKVDLPKQLPSRLETLKLACLDTTFEKNPAACPQASKVGFATATTPVLPVHLQGPAYFVSHGGAKWPELIVALQGQGVTVYLHGETFIDNKTGVTSSTFKTIPDVPIGTFQLTLPEGPYSALAAPSGQLCSRALRMPTTFHAQNGMRINQSTPITVTGCQRHKTHKHKHKKRKHGKGAHKHRK
jgi:hypothetical protein